tara:strand:- start:974 stop:1756 length:783 start_codon:yes stop_codon:yes gene_type:complete
MQLTPRYLIPNTTTLVLDQAGFTVEYRPVYARTLKVFKGIDNVLQFQAKNADHRPTNIIGYTPRFVAFNDEQELILEIEGVPLEDGSSAMRGMFTVTITESELLDLKQQNITYNVHMEDVNNAKILTYANSHFESTGIIYISASAYPGPLPSVETTNFPPTTQDLDEWGSDPIYASPERNSNNALHTVAIYSDGYTGTVTVQGTLENTITNETIWADLAVLTLAQETEPFAANVYGTVTYLRFIMDVDPADLISKIVIRN